MSVLGDTLFAQVGTLYLQFYNRSAVLDTEYLLGDIWLMLLDTLYLPGDIRLMLPDTLYLRCDIQSLLLDI